MNEVVREVVITHQEGLHARPVMKFVHLATSFRARVSVTNITRSGETVDGKSAMHMMLLEGTQGCTLRIQAVGEDAEAAATALADLVRRDFDLE